MIGEGTNLNATTKCANQTGCNGRVLDSGKNCTMDSTALRHHDIHVNYVAELGGPIPGLEQLKGHV